jgi:hypothetical protein
MTENTVNTKQDGDPSQNWINHLDRMTDEFYSKGKDRAIPLRGRRGPYVYESLRFPYISDSRLTDGTNVVSLSMRRPPLTPRKIPDTRLC